MSRTIKSLLAMAAALAFAGCGAEKKVPAKGSALLSVSTFALKADVQSVNVAVMDGNTILQEQVLTRTNLPGAVFEGRFDGLPVGTWTFTAQAFDAPNASGNVLYEGSIAGDVTAGGLSQVIIVLQEISGKPNPFVNHAPAITGLTAGAAQAVFGQQVPVTVTAVDPDAGDVISYAWTSIGGGSFLSGANTASAVWVAPSTGGTFVLRITVTDQRGGTAAAELTITVPIGTVNVFASLNAAPFITSISNTPVFDAANPTPPATSVTLTVVASDDSGLPLTFAWASDAVGGCGGTFTDSTAATTSFLPSVTDPVGAVCTAIVTVTDGTGLFSTGTVTFGVDLPASDFPPRLVLAQQSALRVASGATVQFTAQFFDPNAGVDLAPTFTSTAPAGALPLTGPAGAGASSVTFTFPDCSGGPFDYVITATATVNGAVGPISAAKSFTVTCQP